jgi:hypothetical protein
MILSVLFGCVITLSAVATKKTTIGNTDNCWLMTLVNSAETVPLIGLPPKGAKFCHTLNILLVGRWHRCALSRLYFNSSVVGQLVGWSVGQLVGRLVSRVVSWSVGQLLVSQLVNNKGSRALGGFSPKG